LAIDTGQRTNRRAEVAAIAMHDQRDHVAALGAAAAFPNALSGINPEAVGAAANHTSAGKLRTRSLQNVAAAEDLVKYRDVFHRDFSRVILRCAAVARIRFGLHVYTCHGLLPVSF
jgi:hypothetical protein